MKYMGSKNRIAKEILPIILKDRKPDQWYVEPFCGGFNIIDKVNGRRIANDSNFYLIELFMAIQNGWIPPSSVTEQEYQEIKNNKKLYDPGLVGFVGFGCSYSGKWFGGYARDKRKSWDFAMTAKLSLMKQLELIKNVEFKNCNYLEYNVENYIIYCDPPYNGTTEYFNGKFDHQEFWETMREWSKNNMVYISEYFAPKDFIPIWKKQVKTDMKLSNGNKDLRIEKLFIHKSKTQ